MILSLSFTVVMSTPITLIIWHRAVSVLSLFVTLPLPPLSLFRNFSPLRLEICVLLRTEDHSAWFQLWCLFFFLHCRTSAWHCRSTARWEWKWDQNSLGSEQENTTKSQTNTTNQTPKTKTQARSLSCLEKCKLGETSETCASLSPSKVLFHLNVLLHMSSH